jgi:hypothetical protein
MSYFHRPDATPESETESRTESGTEYGTESEPGASRRSPFADFGDRVARWFASPARELVDDLDVDQLEQLDPDHDPTYQLLAEPETDPAPPRFPLASVGYDRVAVDEQLAQFERELDELRARHEPPISITEEIERIGEQTASILVVAHDKAHETTRLAQEQADRCIADAASNAVAITAEAKERLRALDNETDLVWRERDRLIEDVRVVSAALGSLAEEATARFPAESKTSEGQTRVS